MRLRILFIAIAFSMFNLKSYTQVLYPKQENAEELQKRILIVELGEPDEKKLKKYAKEEKNDPGKTLRYIERIERNNAVKKMLFENHWTFHSKEKIEFRTSKEVEEIVKAKDERYAIASYGWRREMRTESLRKKLIRYDVYCLAIYFAENAKSLDWADVDNAQVRSDGEKWTIYHGGYVIKVSFPYETLSEKENILMAKQLQYHLRQSLKPERPEYKMVGASEFGLYKEKALTLKTKTLLINEAALREGVTAETIANFYPYPFKITTLDEIKSSVLEKDGYAFLQSMWSDNQKRFGVLVLDALTGETLIEIATGMDITSLKDEHFEAINTYIEKYEAKE